MSNPLPNPKFLHLYEQNSISTSSNLTCYTRSEFPFIYSYSKISGLKSWGKKSHLVGILNLPKSETFQRGNAYYRDQT